MTSHLSLPLLVAFLVLGLHTRTGDAGFNGMVVVTEFDSKGSFLILEDNPPPLTVLCRLVNLRVHVNTRVWLEVHKDDGELLSNATCVFLVLTGTDYKYSCDDVHLTEPGEYTVTCVAENDDVGQGGDRVNTARLGSTNETLSLGQDCTDDYVKKGHFFNCTCQFADNVVGDSFFVEWTKVNNIWDTTRLSTTAVTLSRVKSEISPMSGTCLAKYKGQIITQVAFITKYASPPEDNPVITITNNGIEVTIINGKFMGVTVGSILSIKCVVDGGTPTVSNVTLTYGSEVETASGTEVSIQRTMDEAQHMTLVTCTAEHVTASYDKDTNFTINVLLPPENDPVITVTKNCNDVITIVDDDILRVEVGEMLLIHCLVEGGNPVVNWIVLTYGTAENPDRMETSTNNEETIEATVEESHHLYVVTCSALHVTGSYDKVTSFTIFVQVPPENNPVINLSNNDNDVIYDVVNGQIIAVNVGEILTIQCVVEGGRPAVSNVTLTYGSEVETASGKETSIQRTMDEAQHMTLVMCTAEHVTASYDKDTSFTIFVLLNPKSGPNITVTNNANDVTDVVNGDTIDVEMGEILSIECVVQGGRPAVSNVTLTYGSEVETAQDTQVSIRRTIDKTHHQAQVTCTAEHMSGTYNEETKFTLNVPFPPENNPVIAITNNDNDVINVVNGDTIDVIVGDILSIQCVVQGGNPDVSNVTLTYGLEVEAANANEVTAQRTIDKSHHLNQVTCTAEHVTGLYDKTTSWTINVLLPPENDPVITVTKNCNDVITIVDDDILRVEVGEMLLIHCLVEGGNPVVYRTTLTYGTAENPDRVETSRNNEKTIEATVEESHHLYVVTCSALHVTGSYDKVTSFTIFVQVPPENNPVITLSNNPLYDVVNGQVIAVNLGEILTIQCVVEGGRPAVSNVTLTYGSEVETASGKETSIQRTMDEAQHMTLVMCTAEHVTASYDKDTSFTIFVLLNPKSGPNITVTNNANDVTDVVNGDTIDVEMGEILSIECVVQGGRPAVSNVTLTYGSEVETAQDTQVSIRRTIDKTHHQAQVTCTAEHMSGTYNEETKFTLNVPFPPENNPAITITNNDNDVINVVNGDTIDVTVGEILSIQCVVQGGNPDVSNVTLTYGLEVEAANASEVTTQRTIDKSHHLTQVTCTAEHVTGLYHKTISWTINVLLPPEIQNYTINGQVSDRVEVDKGAEVTFECLAEGNPVPEMAIKGVLTNVTLGGGEVDRSTVNQIKLTTTIRSAVVLDTDVYVCTAVVAGAPPVRRRRKRCADVLESQVKQTGTLVVIGPPVPTFPEDNPPLAKSRPDGRLVAQVEVIAHPKPESYTLVKIIGEEGEDPTLHEIPRQHYVVETETVNCRITIVKLYAVDFQIEDSRYKFSIDNGEGDPTVVFLGITREADPEDSGHTKVDDSDYNIMLALAIVAVVGFVVVIAMIVFYIYWINEGKGKLKSRQKTSPQNRKRQTMRQWQGSRY